MQLDGGRGPCVRMAEVQPAAARAVPGAPGRRGGPARGLRWAEASALAVAGARGPPPRSGGRTTRWPRRSGPTGRPVDPVAKNLTCWSPGAPGGGRAGGDRHRERRATRWGGFGLDIAEFDAVAAPGPGRRLIPAEGAAGHVRPRWRCGAEPLAEDTYAALGRRSAGPAAPRAGSRPSIWLAASAALELGDAAAWPRPAPRARRSRPNRCGRPPSPPWPRALAAAGDRAGALPRAGPALRHSAGRRAGHRPVAAAAAALQLDLLRGHRRGCRLRCPPRRPAGPPPRAGSRSTSSRSSAATPSSPGTRGRGGRPRDRRGGRGGRGGQVAAGGRADPGAAAAGARHPGVPPRAGRGRGLARTRCCRRRSLIDAVRASR